MSEKIGVVWLLPFLMFFCIGLFNLNAEFPLTIQYLPDNNVEDIERGYTEITYNSPTEYAPRALFELISGSIMSLLLFEVK